VLVLVFPVEGVGVGVEVGVGVGAGVGVGVGVGFMVLSNMLLTAASASSLPKPEIGSKPGASKSAAVPVKMLITSTGGCSLAQSNSSYTNGLLNIALILTTIGIVTFSRRKLISRKKEDRV